MLPRALRSLVQELSKLPGVGERTALRYTLHLLRGRNSPIESLIKGLEEVQASIGTCPTCFFWTDMGKCSLCEENSRVSTKLCIVRDAPDVLALEKFKKHPWKYHVLQGFLSPLAGVGPKQIRMEELFTRIAKEGFEELILAFDATLEGDATALYLKQQATELGLSVKISRTALGLPAGSSVEYLDPSTLEQALKHRFELS
ncbi:MAG: recombination mediator RecR [Bdellovibrionota bacterium]